MNTSVTSAFTAMPRKNFLPGECAGDADLNIPLPIGFGQTNSQPETVELMLNWLEVSPGNSVLDVGAGSGWTTALLAHLTGRSGRVIATEIVPELVEFGRKNCERLKIKNVEFHQARAQQLGWPAKAPYDRILVSAAAQNIPAELLAQLANGGRLIIPVVGSIWIIDKDEDGAITSVEKPGFLFVRLIQ